jgi:hypothetical protein
VAACSRAISPYGFAGPGVEYGKPQKVSALMHVMPYAMPRSMLRANLAIAYADQAKLTDATVQRTYDMMLTSGVRSVNVACMEQVVLPGIGHVPQEEAPQETIIPLRDFLAR